MPAGAKGRATRSSATQAPITHQRRRWTHRPSRSKIVTAGVRRSRADRMAARHEARDVRGMAPSYLRAAGRRPSTVSAEAPARRSRRSSVFRRPCSVVRRVRRSRPEAGTRWEASYHGHCYDAIYGAALSTLDASKLRNTHGADIRGRRRARCAPLHRCRRAIGPTASNAGDTTWRRPCARQRRAVAGAGRLPRRYRRPAPRRAAARRPRTGPRPGAPGGPRPALPARPSVC